MVSERITNKRKILRWSGEGVKGRCLPWSKEEEGVYIFLMKQEPVFMPVQCMLVNDFFYAYCVLACSFYLASFLFLVHYVLVSILYVLVDVFTLAFILISNLNLYCFSCQHVCVSSIYAYVWLFKKNIMCFIHLYVLYVVCMFVYQAYMWICMAWWF